MSAHNQKPTKDASTDHLDLITRYRSRAVRSIRFVTSRPEPRVIAAVVFERMLTRSESAASSLMAVFLRYPHLDDRGRSRTTELVYTVLRMRQKVDAQLSAHATRALPNDSALLSHLLVAATEILFLDVDHASGPAAIDLAVAQVETLRGPRVAGIAYGILSRLLASQTSRLTRQ